MEIPQTGSNEPLEKKKKLGNVFYIGLLSFFGGISQDIFVPILPLYLTNVLGLDKTFIGASEGLVTAGASLFKIIAGFLTDKFGKKKPFIFMGYLFFFDRASTSCNHNCWLGHFGTSLFRRRWEGDERFSERCSHC